MKMESLWDWNGEVNGEKWIFISSFLLVNSRYFRANSETTVKINSKGNNHHKTSKDDKFSKGNIS